MKKIGNCFGVVLVESKSEGCWDFEHLPCFRPLAYFGRLMMMWLVVYFNFLHFINHEIKSYDIILPTVLRE